MKSIRVDPNFPNTGELQVKSNQISTVCRKRANGSTGSRGGSPERSDVIQISCGATRRGTIPLFLSTPFNFTPYLMISFQFFPFALSIWHTLQPQELIRKSSTLYTWARWIQAAFANVRSPPFSFILSDFTYGPQFLCRTEISHSGYHLHTRIWITSLPRMSSISPS